MGSFEGGRRTLRLPLPNLQEFGQRLQPA
jgi:hypothetical protein